MARVPDDIPQASKDCLQGLCQTACLGGGYLNCKTFLAGRREHLRRKHAALLQSLQNTTGLSKDQLRYKELEQVMIPAAMKRLDDKTYGHCSTCRRTINKERLEHLPDAERCTTCQARVDGEAAA